MAQQKNRGNHDFATIRQVMDLPTVLYFNSCKLSCLKFMLTNPPEITGEQFFSNVVIEISCSKYKVQWGHRRSATLSQPPYKKEYLELCRRDFQSSMEFLQVPPRKKGERFPAIHSQSWSDVLQNRSSSSVRVCRWNSARASF